MKKPPKLGTVWVGQAMLQVIDHGSMKWVTLAVCLDTPNAIAKAAAQLIAEEPSRKGRLWVRGNVTERTLL